MDCFGIFSRWVGIQGLILWCPSRNGRAPIGRLWMGVAWGALIAGITVLSSCGLPAVSAPSAEREPPVQPAPPTPPISDSATAPSKKISGIQFTIQIGAFSTAEAAAGLAAQLIRKGVDAYYFIDEDGLSKVRLERFETRAAASQWAMRLRSLGWIDEFFIVRPAAANHHIGAKPSLGRNIVRTARRFIGTAYRWGGESAHAGFDCSGLTMTVYRLNGMDLPRNSRDQFRAGTPVKRSALKEGDLVFFATGRPQRVSHVGIYTGGGRFIHAPGRGKNIRFSSMSSGYFSRRFIGARRHF
jgi:hypothetical protein